MFKNILGTIAHSFGELAAYSVDTSKGPDHRVGVWDVFQATRKQDSVLCSIFVLDYAKKGG